MIKKISKKLFIALLLLMLIPSCKPSDWFKTKEKLEEKIIGYDDIKELEYVITPELDIKSPRMNVDLFIRLKEKPKTKCTLYTYSNDRLGKIKDLYKNIENITVLGANATIKDTNKPNEKVIKTIETDTIHINYKVTCPLKNVDYIYGDNDLFRPIISKKYFFMLGHNSIIVPRIDMKDVNKNLTVILKWKKIPKDWNLANSFGTNQKEQHLLIPIKNFIEFAFSGGDFRIKKIAIKNKPVYIAIRGTWPLEDNIFFNQAEKIIREQRDFWNDYDFPYFLALYLPAGNHERLRGLGGMFYNTLLECLGTKGFSKKRLAQHTSHENLHEWIGRKIKIGKPEELIYWFYEGFTDYYSYLLILRAGLITFKDYLQEYNKRLYKLYTSSVKNVPNTEILKHFWKDKQIQELPYLRGQILAHNWNAQIKKETNDTYSLDNVMRDILKAAVTHDQIMTNHFFKQIIKKYIKEGIDKEFKKYVEDGEIIIPDENAFGPCCILIWNKIKKKQKDGSIKIFDIPQYELNKQMYEKDKEKCLRWLEK